MTGPLPRSSVELLGPPPRDGNGHQRARVFETAQVASEGWRGLGTVEMKVETHIPPLDALDRRVGVTGAVGTRYGPKVPDPIERDQGGKGVH